MKAYNDGTALYYLPKHHPNHSSHLVTYTHTHTNGKPNNFIHYLVNLIEITRTILSCLLFFLRNRVFN